MSNTEPISLTIQTSAELVPAVPPWFGEVAIVQWPGEDVDEER